MGVGVWLWSSDFESVGVLICDGGVLVCRWVGWWSFGSWVGRVLEF